MPHWLRGDGRPCLHIHLKSTVTFVSSIKYKNFPLALSFNLITSLIEQTGVTLCSKITSIV